MPNHGSLDSLCTNLFLTDDQLKADSERMFSFICELAINKDKEKLLVAQRSSISLNMCLGKDLLTPLAWLVLQGQHEAVKFLIEELNVNATSAAVTYAALGYTDRVEDLILHHTVNLSAVAAGYERGKYFSEADDLVKRGACLGEMIVESARFNRVGRVNALLNRGVNVTDAIFGYMRGKHPESAQSLGINSHNSKYAILGLAQKGIHSLVDEMIESAKNNSIVYQELLDYAAYGYARTGDITRAKKLIVLGANVCEVVSGLAQSGYVLEVREFLSKDITFQRTINDDLNNRLHAEWRLDAIQSFAMGGHDNIVTHMLDEIAQLPESTALRHLHGYLCAAAKGFALAGDIVNAKKIIKQDITTSNESLVGFAQGGFLDHADKMLSKLHDIRGYQIQMVVKEYEQGQDFSVFSDRDMALNRLSRINDAELRAALVKSAVQLGYVKSHAESALLKDAKVENKKVRAAYSALHPSALSKVAHQFFSLFHHESKNVISQPAKDEVKIIKMPLSVDMR